MLLRERARRSPVVHPVNDPYGFGESFKQCPRHINASIGGVFALQQGP